MKETLIKKPLSIGDTVYLVLEDTLFSGTMDGFYITQTKVTDVSVNHGFTLSCDLWHSRINGRNIEHDDFRPWDQVGEKVFFTKEEAEMSINHTKNYAGYKFFTG